MFAVLVHVVRFEDGLEVVLHGAVLLGAKALLLVTRLHLLDEGLEELGILLGEVRLLLTPVSYTHLTLPTICSV